MLLLITTINRNQIQRANRRLWHFRAARHGNARQRHVLREHHHHPERRSHPGGMGHRSEHPVHVAAHHTKERRLLPL